MARLNEVIVQMFLLSHAEGKTGDSWEGFAEGVREAMTLEEELLRYDVVIKTEQIAETRKFSTPEELVRLHARRIGVLMVAGELNRHLPRAWSRNNMSPLSISENGAISMNIPVDLDPDLIDPNDYCRYTVYNPALLLSPIERINGYWPEGVKESARLEGLPHGNSHGVLNQ